MIKLRKEASNRQFYRVELNGHQQCVVMVLDQADDVKLAAQKIIDATEVFKFHKINVPDIFRFFPDEGVFILRDMGRTSLELFCVKYGKIKVVSLYKKIMEQFLGMARSETPPELLQKLPCQTMFTGDIFFKELKHFLLHSRMADHMSPESLTELEEEWMRLSQTLADQPKVLLHRDLHSRNILVTQEEEIAIVDHQDARMGPYTYDLVSLLKDSYVDLPIHVERTLLEYYLNECQSGVFFSDEASFFRDYYLCLFQRSLKAAGTFFYQVREKKNLKYKRYIPTVISYALVALDKLILPVRTKLKWTEYLRAVLQAS